jgi:hypothetical protein
VRKRICAAPNNPIKTTENHKLRDKLKRTRSKGVTLELTKGVSQAVNARHSLRAKPFLVRWFRP